MASGVFHGVRSSGMLSLREVFLDNLFLGSCEKISLIVCRNFEKRPVMLDKVSLLYRVTVRSKAVVKGSGNV
jgi:hypothetical protein